MKIPNTDIDVRVDKPPEKIEMVAHSAECRYCKGIVKMMRDMNTGRLQLDKCQCLLCGQSYFVEIKGDVGEWELNQWRQKAEKGNLLGKVKKETLAEKEKAEKPEKDERVVITMRCIDMVSPTSEVDKVPCSECGEITWISKSFRGKNIDKIICENCFFKSGKHKDENYRACVTEECLNDAFITLESRGIRTTKEEMIRRMEDRIGKKLKIVKPKKEKKVKDKK